MTDAETTLTTVMRNPGDKDVGFCKDGRWRNDRFDAIEAQSSTGSDPKKREDLVKPALREFKERAHQIPLERQVVPRAARANVDVVHRAEHHLTVQRVSGGR